MATLPDEAERQRRASAVMTQLSYACSLPKERRQADDPGRAPVNLCVGLGGTEALYDLVPTAVGAIVPPIFIR
jgi:hypothetical protein